MLFIVCRTADISALSGSLDSAEIYISCSVHKCEWHCMYIEYISNQNLMKFNFSMKISLEHGIFK